MMRLVVIEGVKRRCFSRLDDRANARLERNGDAAWSLFQSGAQQSRPPTIELCFRTHSIAQSEPRS